MKTHVTVPTSKQSVIAAKQFGRMNLPRAAFTAKTDKPWETDEQIRKSAWIHVLKKAGVRYRNPYQTRHTYASMLLSAGENQWWVAEQMGHETTQMIMRHYGKWIPDQSNKSGYQPTNDWEQAWKENCTETARSD